MKKYTPFILAACLSAAGCSNPSKQEDGLQYRTVHVKKLGVYQFADLVVSPISREEGEEQLLDYAKSPESFPYGWLFVERGKEEFFVQDIREHRERIFLVYSFGRKVEHRGLKALKNGDVVSYYLLCPDGGNTEEEWQAVTNIPRAEDFLDLRRIEKEVRSKGCVFKEGRAAGAYGIFSFMDDGRNGSKELQPIIDEAARETVLNKKDPRPLPEKIDACSRKLGEKGVRLTLVRRNSHFVRR